jgi:hypothetical protein
MKVVSTTSLQGDTAAGHPWPREKEKEKEKDREFRRHDTP